MNIGDFFIKLGVISDTGSIQKFSTVVNQGVSELKNMSIAALAVGYTVAKVTDELVNTIVKQENFNKQTGLSIDLLNKWQKAATLSDVTLNYEEISSNIQGIQKNLTELQFGGGNTQAFRWLGIDVTGKDAFEVLEQVRTSIKDIDDRTATQLIEKMGLSPKFISVLRLSRQEFDKISKGGFLTANQRKKVVELGTAFTRLKLELTEIKNRTLANISPLLMRVFGHIENGARHLETFINGLRSSDAQLKTFQAALIALAAIFLPITTAIGIAIVLFDDLWTAMNGGESLIGETLKMLSDPLFWQWGLEGLIGSMKDLFNWMVKIGDSINNWAIDKVKGLAGFFGFGSSDQASKLQQGTTTQTSSGSSSKTAEVNNTYHISSNGNGQDVADQIATEQTRQMNTAFDELSGGTL